MVFRRLCWILAALALVTGVEPAAAQKRSAKAPKKEVSDVYDVPSMINQAVMNISRRYNLNKSQHDFTQEMMEERVSRFLFEHQDEIYPLIRDLTRAKFKGDNMSVAQRKRIGKAAPPLLEAAQKEILTSNEEWREILSEEQKRLHDWDLKEMGGQFVQFHENFNKMEQGIAVDDPIFGEQSPSSPPPPMPPKPPDQPLARSLEPVVERDVAGAFARAVERFIKEYDLDPGQAVAARSIGREYKGYADVFRNVRKDEFKAARDKAEQGRTSGDLERARQGEQELDKLNARFRELLDQMKARLITIPRQAQKLAYQKKRVKSGAASPSKQDDKTEPAPARSAEQEADQLEKNKAEQNKPKKKQSKPRAGKRATSRESKSSPDQDR